MNSTGKLCSQGNLHGHSLKRCGRYASSLHQKRFVKRETLAGATLRTCQTRGRFRLLTRVPCGLPRNIKLHAQ